MAINIQEILHPSDSDSIKFAKINYNFDQILANGGGPIGPKGAQGNPGAIGNTGATGPQGEKGIKGDSGETTSPWKSITIDLDTQDGVDNLTILKPKPDTDKETPVIWLGDSSFVNAGSTLNDGDTTLRSTLNVGRHYDIANSAINAEYATFWHDASNKIKLDSEDQSGYVRFNLSPVTPLVGNAPDIRFQINTPTIHTETFKLDNMAAAGVLADGMIRYNSGGQKFEGYINGAWVEFCTAPCGSGTTASISFDPAGDLTLNQDGSLFTGLSAFTYSDWTGSLTGVDSSGNVNIVNGNATTVTSNPASFAANSTAGDNQVSLTLDVTVPSGYSNTGSIVQSGTLTVTQPTSVSNNTYNLNINEGNSNPNWNISSAEIVSGATETSWTSVGNGGQLIFETLDGSAVQVKVSATAETGREFVAGSNGAFSVTQSGTQEIQDITTNATTADYIISFNTTGALTPPYGSTTGTWTITVEAVTQALPVTGEADYYYGETLNDVCAAMDYYVNGTGSLPAGTGQVTAVEVNPGTVSPTNAQWVTATKTAIGNHRAVNVGGGTDWVMIADIRDENGDNSNMIFQAFLGIEVNSSGLTGTETGCTSSTTQVGKNTTYTFNFGTQTPSPQVEGGVATLGYTWDGPSLNSSQFSFTNGGQSILIGSGGAAVSIDSVSSSSITFTFIGGTSFSSYQIPFTFDGAYTLQMSSNTSTNLSYTDGSTCIVVGQPIAMADGTTKLVEDIQVGDEVMALSIAGLGLEEDAWKTWSTTDFSSSSDTTTITEAVQDSWDKYHTLEFSSGPSLKITHEHPVLSNRGGEYSFRRVDALQVNDEVYNANIGGWVTITANNIVEETVQTVMLGAETADNYFAHGIVVHNAGNQK